MTLDFFKPRERVIEMTCSYKACNTYLFRYEGHCYFNESGEEDRAIYLKKFPITRETPKCFVIDEFDKERFVLKTARKRFAYPTIELAWESFLKRTEKRVFFAEQKLAQAKGIEELSKSFCEAPRETTK